MNSFVKMTSSKFTSVIKSSFRSFSSKSFNKNLKKLDLKTNEKKVKKEINKKSDSKPKEDLLVMSREEYAELFANFNRYLI